MQNKKSILLFRILSTYLLKNYNLFKKDNNHSTGRALKPLPIISALSTTLTKALGSIALR